MMNKRDQYASNISFQNKGIAIGEARGREEGRTEGILQTARQMKTKGFNATIISEVTGLSEEKINSL